MKNEVMIDLKGGKNNADIINDLSTILAHVGITKSQEARLIPELLQYIIERDFSVWHHAYRIGKESQQT